MTAGCQAAHDRVLWRFATLAESYFDGCSNGGRQALVEATRFPDDYDGIIAGDPFLDIRTIANGARLAKQQLTPTTYLPATLLPVDRRRGECELRHGRRGE